MFNIAAFSDLRRTALRTLTLEARALLTDEAQELLRGTYGLDHEGRFEPIANLPAVQSLPEATETRARLEQHLRDEAAAGRNGPEAVVHLVREMAFTHLNRLSSIQASRGAQTR